MSCSHKGIGQNIMTQYLDANDILGDINLSKDKYPLATYVVVEGYWDKKVFEKFTTQQTCQIVLANGKGKISELIYKPQFVKEKCIAIRDRDCTILNKNAEMHEKLFFSDTRDLIMDIIKNSESFDNFLNNFNIQGAAQLRNKILKNCKIIGLMRCFSEKNNKNIHFKNKEQDKYRDFKNKCRDFNYYYDLKSKTFDFKKFVEVLCHNPRNDYELLKDPNLETHIKKTYKTESDDLYNICQGHDFIIFLYNFLWQDSNYKRFLYFEHSFYNSYEFNHFKETKMYKNIIAWEERNDYLSIFEEIANNT